MATSARTHQQISAAPVGVRRKLQPKPPPALLSHCCFDVSRLLARGINGLGDESSTSRASRSKKKMSTAISMSNCTGLRSTTPRWPGDPVALRGAPACAKSRTVSLFPHWRSSGRLALHATMPTELETMHWSDVSGLWGSAITRTWKGFKICRSQ